MELEAGKRLRSSACDTEVIVVRAPSSAVDLTCGGHPMYAIDAEAPTAAELDPLHSGGTAIGKRYADEASGLELLCTKAGVGSLALAGEPIPVKGAKPLPSSN